MRDELLRIRQEAPKPSEEDLARWAERSRLQGEPKPAREGAAAPEGPCGVCEQRPATATCYQCRRGVCAQDHWVMLGLCRACVPPEQIQRARQRKDAAHPDLGIKWVGE